MAKAATAGRQTSRKAGVTSTAKKMDSSRHGFGQEPAARKVTGAFGAEGKGARPQPGTATTKRGAASALGAMGKTKNTKKTATRRSG